MHLEYKTFYAEHGTYDRCKASNSTIRCKINQTKSTMAQQAQKLLKIIVYTPFLYLVMNKLKSRLG